MDWDAKMPSPSWDLGTVVGPSGVAAGGALDLKLGAPTSWKAAAAAAPAPPPPAPAKRPRAGQGQGQGAAPACSVEGCTADLSKCRDYHRRHKVCGPHSKTPVVTVAGQQQRFCQQCSRFHLLVEFDELKKSCRKRLDGHNRRRRKPQPDPLNPGGLFAGHHAATRFPPYQQIFSTASMAEPKWPASAVKAEADAFHETYYPALHLNGGGAPLFHGKERKHFPFLTDHDGGGGSSAFSCQPFTITPPSESSSNSSRHSNGKMFAHDGGLDNCALSLLSDSPAPPAQIMIPAAQVLAGGAAASAAGLQYGGVVRLPSESDVSLTGLSYVRVGDKDASMLTTSARHSHTSAAAAAAATTSAAATQLQYHGYYHVSADQGSSDGGAIQALPFSSW